MLILIAIILLCSAMSDWAAASDWETSEREAERRHRELMEVTRKKTLSKSNPKITRRRFIKDKHGNILAEEIIVDDDEPEEY